VEEKRWEFKKVEVEQKRWERRGVSGREEV
jgi:hypothetical protein